MKILSCPFCLSKRVKVEEGITWFTVVCQSITCRAQGPEEVSEDRAISAWNIRPEEFKER
jgi:hypothetical protein